MNTLEDIVRHLLKVHHGGNGAKPFILLLPVVN